MANDRDPVRRLTLVASDVAPIGGMERVAFELGSRLLERGWSLTVIARSCALPSGPRLRFIRMRSPSRPVSLALACDFVLGSIALRRHRAGIVQTNNATVWGPVDVVHAHFCEAAFRRTGISRSRRATIAYRLNSLIASRISLWCERLVYRSAGVQRVVCVSDGLARETASLHPAIAAALRAIPNGVDTRAFDALEPLRAPARADLGLAPGDLLALFVGGDWHRKGLRHAVEALRHAPGWRLAVVGDGDGAAFARLAAEHEVSDRVHFLGGAADPQPWYAAADALVFPSHYEAFPLVALEAAAAGLPLLVPLMNGTEELIEDGVGGWFVERDGAAIGARLRLLGEDSSRRAAMGAAARAAAERFDWERVVDRFEELYAELASASSTSSHRSMPARRSRLSSAMSGRGSGVL